MTESVKAICLKAVDYMDNDKMLLLFTAESGKISARIRGVKKAQAKLKFCAQPFCFGEYELAEKSSRYIVTNCSEIESFSSLSKNLDAFYCGCTMLEFCSSVLQENEPNTSLFITLLRCLKSLTNISPKLVLIKFLLKGLKNTGFGITFNECYACGDKTFPNLYLNLTEGGATCPKCTQGECYQLTPAETSCLKIIDETPFERLQILKYDNRYDGMLRALSKYVEVFVKRLNSIQYLF